MTAVEQPALPRVAGGSAGERAAALTLEAQLLQLEAAQKLVLAERFARGEVGEVGTADALARLSPFGYYALHDRLLAGRSRGNVDHLVVGPGGVFVLDTKNWSGEVRLERESLWQGQDCRDDDLHDLERVSDDLRAVLGGLGLPPRSVRSVLVLHGAEEREQQVQGVMVVGSLRLAKALLLVQRALTTSQVEAVLKGLLDLYPPAVIVPPDIAEDAPIAQQNALPPQQQAPPLADTLFDDDELEQAALEAAAQRPLEDWMVWLHPRQAEYVRRHFSGPALLRGPAGTGKTVVALHRLAHLAERRAHRLLFLSFVRTLPAVQRTAYSRLSPATVNRVEFTSLHSWASQLLTSRGSTIRVDLQACGEAYQEAWRRVGPGSVLDQPEQWSYWSEEVKQVLRGRRIATLEDYQALKRRGRGNRLGPVQREMLWQLKTAYEELLRERGLHDFDDLLLEALRSLQERPLEVPYDVVVVDEVQDLTMTGLQLVAAAAQDGADNLLLVGDSRQAVFAGGVSPAQAGLSVQGRSTVLEVNYRNTMEVLEFAAPLVASDEDILGDDGPEDQGAASVERRGLPPIVAQGRSRRDLDAALLSIVRATQNSGRCTWGAMAILCQHRWGVTRAQELLSGAGVPHVALETWAGQASNAVKIGTIKRGKGLEFPFVFLPWVEDRLLVAGASAELSDEELDAWRLARRELYVGATRARDGLWLGVLSRQEPRSPEWAGGSGAGTATSTASGLYALVAKELGVVVAGGPARFSDDGWTRQGVVAALCAACAGPYQAYRKPYTAGGKEFRYWALVCTSCRTCSEPAVLEPEARKALRTMRDQ